MEDTNYSNVSQKFWLNPAEMLLCCLDIELNGNNTKLVSHIKTSVHIGKKFNVKPSEIMKRVMAQKMLNKIAGEKL